MPSETQSAISGNAEPAVLAKDDDSSIVEGAQQVPQPQEQKKEEKKVVKQQQNQQQLQQQPQARSDAQAESGVQQQQQQQPEIHAPHGHDPLAQLATSMERQLSPEEYASEDTEFLPQTLPKKTASLTPSPSPSLTGASSLAPPSPQQLPTRLEPLNHSPISQTRPLTPTKQAVPLTQLGNALSATLGEVDTKVATHHSSEGKASSPVANVITSPSFELNSLTPAVVVQPSQHAAAEVQAQMRQPKDEKASVVGPRTLREDPWSLELLGRRLAALQEEQRALKVLPGQMTQALNLLESINASVGVSIVGHSSSYHQDGPPGSRVGGESSLNANKNRRATQMSTHSGTSGGFGIGTVMNDVASTGGSRRISFRPNGVNTRTPKNSRQSVSALSGNSSRQSVLTVTKVVDKEKAILPGTMLEDDFGGSEDGGSYRNPSQLKAQQSVGEFSAVVPESLHENISESLSDNPATDFTQSSPTRPSRRSVASTFGVGAHSSGEISLGGPLHRPNKFQHRATTLDYTNKAYYNRRFVLAADSKPRLVWDFLLILSVIFIALVVPIQLAYFCKNCPNNGKWLQGGDEANASLIATDILWLLGFVLNFFTDSFSDDGEPLGLCRRIAWHYTRSWLWFDLLAAVPLFLNFNRSLEDVASAFRLVRFLRFGSLVLRLRKGLRLPILIHVKSMVQVLTFVHVMTCGWRIAHAEDSPTIDSWQGVYVSDCYWVFMTITTVGYGDIVPLQTVSRLYAMFAMLTGLVFHGTVVSLLTHFTSGIFNNAVEGAVAETARFMARRHISEETKKRVELNLRRRMNAEQHMLRAEIFDKLSPSVQRDLSLELLSSVMLKFPLFRTALHSFVAELAQAHTWINALPGDLIVEEDMRIQELAFLLQGRLVSSTVEGGAHGLIGIEQEMEAGAWFGEQCLFDDEVVSDGAIVVIEDSELALLRAADYHRICQKYPAILQKHQKLYKAIRDGKIFLSVLQYQPTVGSGRSAITSAPSWFKRTVPRAKSTVSKWIADAEVEDDNE